jgi:hypothetical protein
LACYLAIKKLNTAKEKQKTESKLVVIENAHKKQAKKRRRKKKIY